MHRARPFDDRNHRREMRRTTTLDGPLPASLSASDITHIIRDRSG